MLCSTHHTSHHTGAYQISHDTTAPGHFSFHRPDRTPHPTRPATPRLTGDITTCHPAQITAHTLQPAQYNPLHLVYATSVMVT